MVDNAGYGIFGAVEEISDAEARELFDTTVFGLLAVTRAVLPTLRSQGEGRIVDIGSSAGFAVSAGRGSTAPRSSRWRPSPRRCTMNWPAGHPRHRRGAGLLPLRLQLGSDCVSLVEGKLAAVAKELDEWRDLALSTDFQQA